MARLPKQSTLLAGVGLISANAGLGLRLGGTSIIGQGIYCAIVNMVIVTTLMTAPALKWSLVSGSALARG